MNECKVHYSWHEAHKINSKFLWREPVLAITIPVPVLGHSMGGLITLLAALRDRDQVSRENYHCCGAGAAILDMEPVPHFLLWSRCRTFCYGAGVALFAMEPMPHFSLWRRSRTPWYEAVAALFVMESEPYSLIWSRSHVFFCGAGAAPNVRLRHQLYSCEDSFSGRYFV